MKSSTGFSFYDRRGAIALLVLLAVLGFACETAVDRLYPTPPAASEPCP